MLDIAYFLVMPEVLFLAFGESVLPLFGIGCKRVAWELDQI